MCARFTLIDLSRFTDLFPWIGPPDEQLAARYNIAPSNAVAVVANNVDPKVDFFHWGLIPSWAKDRSIANRMINARAETLASKPAFRNVLKRRRCLIPADGFYEWKTRAGGKTPIYIRMKDGAPFAFGGLWETWRDAGGSVIPSCTIITTRPNELMEGIHDRMPVIVAPEQYKLWLRPDELEGPEVEAMLMPYPAEKMSAIEVSKAVNNPRHDAADCIEPQSSASDFRESLF